MSGVTQAKTRYDDSRVEKTIMSRTVHIAMLLSCQARSRVRSVCTGDTGCVTQAHFYIIDLIFYNTSLKFLSNQFNSAIQLVLRENITPDEKFL